MALTQPDLNMTDIYTEFVGTPSSNNLDASLEDFYHPNGDPWLPTPHSGDISFDDMVGGSGKTARIFLARSWDQDNGGRARRGFQKYKGGLFQYSTGESGSSISAFGDISRNLYFTTGQELIGFYIQSMYSAGSPVYRIYIVKRGSGNSGWTKIKLRYNTKQPGYGHPVSDLTNNWWVHGTAATNYSYEISRTSADEFDSISGSSYNGNLAYFWRYDVPGSGPLLSIFRAIENGAVSRPYSPGTAGQIAIKLA
tara:strand:- start:1459 stop:2217 length:759 start_codon:yes stop_codon:yes gene_type:complete